MCGRWPTTALCASLGAPAWSALLAAGWWWPCPSMLQPGLRVCATGQAVGQGLCRSAARTVSAPPLFAACVRVCVRVWSCSRVWHVAVVRKREEAAEVPGCCCCCCCFLPRRASPPPLRPGPVCPHGAADAAVLRAERLRCCGCGCGRPSVGGCSSRRSSASGCGPRAHRTSWTHTGRAGRRPRRRARKLRRMRGCGPRAQSVE